MNEYYWNNMHIAQAARTPDHEGLFQKIPTTQIKRVQLCAHERELSVLTL